jgi:hypothetical protein
VGDWEGVLRFLLAGLRRMWDLYVGLAARRDASSGTPSNCTTLGVLWVDIDFKAIAEADRLDGERGLLHGAVPGRDGL